MEGGRGEGWSVLYTDGDRPKASVDDAQQPRQVESLVLTHAQYTPFTAGLVRFVSVWILSPVTAVHSTVSFVY